MKIKKEILKVLSVIFVLATLTSCSAVMAASGKRESNVAALQKGDSKAMVMAKIGHAPLRVAEQGIRSIEVYEIEKGNEPSVGRAITHATLDVFTLGLWELVGTPLEATAGEKQYVIVEYVNDVLRNYNISGTVPTGL